MDSLVTTAWLAGELGASDLRIVDASWFLDETDARGAYEAAHIPGAVFMDLADLADGDTDLPMMLPSPAKFASRMQTLGIGDGSRIVLYDRSPLHSAARAWWMLRLFGARAVALLDGGVAKWIAEGRAVDSGVETLRHRHYTVDPDGGAVRSLAQMRANLETGGEQVVDARSPARFAGDEPEPRAGVVPGHIPGSRNLHYATLFEPDGTWKRGDALRAAFAGAGIDRERPVVATCGSGVTAAVLAFGAHLLGHDMAIYDGSWSEWGADVSTPKAKGTA